MLKIDFYESGAGETTVISFPDGSLGIVDGHPSPENRRPSLNDLCRGKQIRFVCLTHPHADHGLELVSLLSARPDTQAFWHTLSDVDVFTYGLGDAQNFRSPIQAFVAEFQKKWAEFLIDLYHCVVSHDIPRKQIHSEVQRLDIGDVEIHFLGPIEALTNSFVDAYRERLQDPKKRLPDPNLLSAVLAIKYGSRVILLGGDALVKNWSDAVHAYRKAGLSKADVLKVPHHGAKNALNRKTGSHQVSYLDICSTTPPVLAVLFAGDSRHPNEEVFGILKRKTRLACVSNGLKVKDRDPLKLGLLGARFIDRPSVCNEHISVSIASDGDVDILRNENCTFCAPQLS